MFFSDEMRSLADWDAKEGETYAFLFGKWGEVTPDNIYVIGKHRQLHNPTTGDMVNSFYGGWFVHRFWKKAIGNTKLEDML